MEANYYIIDIAVIAVIVISALLATARGAVREILSLVAWIGSFYLAYVFYGELSPYLTDWFGITDTRLAEFIAGVAIFLGALLVLQLLAIAISSAVKGEKMGFVNRLFGFIFGGLRGWIIISILYILYSMVIKIDKQPEFVKNANTRPLIVLGSQQIYKIVPAAVWQKMDNHYEDPEVLLPYDVEPTGQKQTEGAENQ